MIDTNNPSYALDLKSMREVQLSNKSLIRIVKNYLSSSGKNNEVYPYKTVEDIELAHKKNQILVPQSKHQSMLYWYHQILINLGEAQMLETIKSVLTLLSFLL